jgi:hypothetical protein
MPEALKGVGPVGAAVYFFSAMIALAFPLPLGAESLFSWFVAPLGGIGGYGLATATRSSAKHWGWGKVTLISLGIVIAGVIPAVLYMAMWRATPPAPSSLYLLGQALLLALTFFAVGYVVGTSRFKFVSE